MGTLCVQLLLNFWFDCFRRRVFPWKIQTTLRRRQSHLQDYARWLGDKSIKKESEKKGGTDWRPDALPVNILRLIGRFWGGNNFRGDSFVVKAQLARRRLYAIFWEFPLISRTLFEFNENVVIESWNFEWFTVVAMDARGDWKQSGVVCLRLGIWTCSTRG